MFHLIRKDILLQKNVLLLWIPVLFVYSYLDISYIWSGFVFSVGIIMSAFSIDEKPSINMLLNSLPYTRNEIVSSKYIGALLFMLIVISAIFIGNLLIHGELPVWKDILFIIFLVMVTISFALPFSYKFKSQYLLIGSITLFGIYMVLINIFIKNLNDIIREFVQTLLSTPNDQIYLFISLVVVFLYLCSWLLSIRIYSKKVF